VLDTLPPYIIYYELLIKVRNKCGSLDIVVGSYPVFQSVAVAELGIKGPLEYLRV